MTIAEILRATQEKLEVAVKLLESLRDRLPPQVDQQFSSESLVSPLKGVNS